MKVYLETLDGLRKIYEKKHKGQTEIMMYVGWVNKDSWYPVRINRRYRLTNRTHKGKPVFLEVIG